VPNSIFTPKNNKRLKPPFSKKPRKNRRKTAKGEIMYTAIVLENISADLLRWIVRGTLKLEENGWKFETAQGNPLPHHMTLNMGDFNSGINHVGMLNCAAEMWFEELVFDTDLGVCAVPIPLALMIEGPQLAETVKSSNEFPHITICIKPGSKPVQSNKMLENIDRAKRCKLDRRYKVKGVVQICK
jgi:hypothetical protein